MNCHLCASDHEFFQPSIRPATRALAVLAAVVAVALSPAARAQTLYVSDFSGPGVSAYNAATGATLANPLVAFSGVLGISVSGSNLLVSKFDNAIGIFNADTGATVNGSFITGADLRYPLVVGGDLFVAVAGGGAVARYNATTGVLINGSFITGLASPMSIAVSGSDMFVANFGSGTIGRYNATTGAVINANFITGLQGPWQLAVSGSNLYVANRNITTVGLYDAGTGATVNATFITTSGSVRGVALSGSSLFVATATTIGVYNATTGTAINASFLSGFTDVNYIAVAAVPEPSTYAALVGLAALGLAAWRRRRQSVVRAPRA